MDGRVGHVPVGEELEDSVNLHGLPLFRLGTLNQIQREYGEVAYLAALAYAKGEISYDEAVRRATEVTA